MNDSTNNVVELMSRDRRLAGRSDRRKTLRTVTGIPVRNSEQLTNSLLHYLIDMIERGEYQTLIDQGMTLKTLDAIRAMPASDIARLVSLRPTIFSVVINPAEVENSLRLLDYQQTQNERLAYFIQHGASAKMVLRVLKVTREVHDAFKSSLRPQVKPGRPPMPNSKQREAILTDYFDFIKKTDDTSAAWIELHQKYSVFSLAALYNVVNEF